MACGAGVGAPSILVTLHGVYGGHDVHATLHTLGAGGWAVTNMEFEAMRDACNLLLETARTIDTSVARTRFGGTAYVALSAIGQTLSMMSVGLASVTEADHG